PQEPMSSAVSSAQMVPMYNPSQPLGSSGPTYAQNPSLQYSPVDKIAQSYLLQWKEVMQSPLAEKRRSFLEGFLAHIEAESQYLSPSIRNDRKYYIYEALLGEALNAGEGEKANVYKNKLYYGFSNGRLPDRLKEMFSLGKYNNGSVSIWGYEHFEGVSSRKDKGSFSKMIFSVYPANSPGMEEKELMQFHLKTINWIDDKLGKYVLVQKPGASQAGPVVTLWDLSFDDPIDYLELREILMTLAMSGDSRGK
ncbi:MAG: hypothetical protein AAF696_32890, partial [Bacteroidota bacterium]